MLSRGLFFLSLAMICAQASGKVPTGQIAGINEDMGLFGKAPVIVSFTSAALKQTSNEQHFGAAQIASARNQFIASLPSELAADVVTTFDYSPAVAMVVDQDGLAKLQDNPSVTSVVRNGRRLPHLLQSIPIVFDGGRAGGAGGGSAVAILDTGVDFMHPAFGGRVVSGACYSGGGYGSEYREIVKLCPGRTVSATSIDSGAHCSLAAYPGCDHGTHVAGIAAGDSGVAPAASIIAIQVFTGIRDYFNRNVCGTGRGRSCIVAFDSDIAKGLERVYTLRNTFNVVSANLSLGGGAYSSTCDGESPSMTNVINRLRDAGIATTISSGNSGRATSISFPACISNAIAVGATSDFTGSLNGNAMTLDSRAYYSNSSRVLDIYAPGSSIRSSVPDGGFASFNGTSMAAPHVAGAFGIINGPRRGLSVDDIEAAMESVGPLISVGGIVRRRLDIRATLSELGISAFSPGAIFDLLLDEELPPPPPPIPPC